MFYETPTDRLIINGCLLLLIVPTGLYLFSGLVEFFQAVLYGL